jgi:hypothetical protein
MEGIMRRVIRAYLGRSGDSQIAKELKGKRVWVRCFGRPATLEEQVAGGAGSPRIKLRYFIPILSCEEPFQGDCPPSAQDEEEGLVYWLEVLPHLSDVPGGKLEPGFIALARIDEIYGVGDLTCPHCFKAVIFGGEPCPFSER